jgi:site-specific DNA-methyltransferase (adenine-specific)
VAGTFKERQGFHGCQMPEQLLGRIIRVSSNPADVVLDPFAGSGTTLAVAKKLGRRWIGCELSDEYVRAATERMNSVQESEALDGPADPIASAPSTANGRKLDRVSFDDSLDSTNRRTAEQGSAANSHSIAPTNGLDVRSAVRTAIVEAFYAAHDGYSIDWLLANHALQLAFHDACRESGLIGGPADWNREILRLRKTGGFPKRGEIKKVHISDDELDAYSFAAEIAWRLTSDKYGSPSLDEILCDPQKSAYFDKTAKRFASGFEPAQFSWAALRLRKASRELVDQVKQFHFVFAKRDFQRFHAWRRLNPERFMGQPGVYLLRDAAKQVLFIAHALNLGRRLVQHADCDAMDDLVPQIAIITGDDLPGEEYQAAFKEHLVRRHEPRWNMRLVGLNSTRAV